MVSNFRKRVLGRQCRVLLVSCLLVAALGCIQAKTAAAFITPGISEETGSDIQKKLKTAATQHELILLLIEKQSFDQVEPEWKKVLDLRLGPKYEGAIAQSLLAIGYKLYEARQFVLGIKLLDISLATVPFNNKAKADIFRFKALLLKDSGDVDGAIQMLRQARELTE